ncbi:MAG: CBS domain-containing protein [Leptolyngbyaceae cyanobacterium SM1_1_3]|nr:CBS domain-containing protein [Leptolyngbyaceae cyanobacterium SM1_1_3]NJN03842.1 CBS domain-containing protein [Leptolyngbyaceae cyanobacterium RM1_1_2]NJO10026.1 CBS domain-containing protein [Leptolyngbyaceae cyanobacterium SL_1_1]
MAKTVADVMTCDPFTVRPETLVKEAVHLLSEKRISSLPVVNNDHELVGVLSEADLMWQVTGAQIPAYVTLLDSVIYLENPARYNQELHKALGQTVSELMTDKPITIAPDETIRKAAQVMHDKQIRCLIVVDEAKTVTGILTQGDIVREMAKNYSERS